MALRSQRLRQLGAPELGRIDGGNVESPIESGEPGVDPTEKVTDHLAIAGCIAGKLEDLRVVLVDRAEELAGIVSGDRARDLKHIPT